jgi:hypothetical protein
MDVKEKLVVGSDDGLIPKQTGRHTVDRNIPLTLTTTVQSLRRTVSKRPNRIGVFLPSPEGGNRSSFENVVFLLFTIPVDGQTPETRCFLN